MALSSKNKAVLDAIAAILNADDDIGSGATPALTWRLRKHAYNHGKSWEEGAWVAPGGRNPPGYHENQVDARMYKVHVVLVTPADGNLTSGMDRHLAVIERVEDIFHNKSGGYLPAGLRNLQTAEWALEQTTVEFTGTFDQTAFGLGYDVSGCTVLVQSLVSRLDASNLGA